MKVGYVIKSYPRLSQTFIVNEILAHEAAGLDLEIFSLRPARDEERHGSVARVKAPVHYLPGQDGSATAFWHEAVELARHVPGIWTRLGTCINETASDVHQALALARRVRERGITHLHAHFGNVATAVARLAGYFAGVPYSFTAHARDIFHEKVVPADLARKLADAKAVVTVSDYNRAFLDRNYGAAAQTVRRIYNGLDMGRFGFAEAGERPPVIVSVGRLIDKKGFEDLIDACGLLRQRGRDFSCLIIGSGPLEEALKARIGRLGLEDAVRMLGSLPQEDVVRQLQGAAAFAAPCVVGPDGDRDGLPTVLLEAMALGTACVSTDVTGIPEILHDGETGLMVGQHDAVALADALERLLDDGALRRRLAQNARRLMEHQFDIHANAARMREVFAGAGQ
jgi:glycosyltransferase involved in cell wall biosynthesis